VGDALSGGRLAAGDEFFPGDDVKDFRTAHCSRPWEDSAASTADFRRARSASPACSHPYEETRIIVACALALALAGCVSAEQQRAQAQAEAAAINAHDDAKCRSYGVGPDSPGYVQCRMNLDNQRAAMRQAIVSGVLQSQLQQATRVVVERPSGNSYMPDMSIFTPPR
jgi:hypothetical protein